MNATATPPGVTLDTDDAWRRMRGQTTGRLAVSVDHQPDVFPVNFLASERSILVRTAPGTKLDDLATNSLVAFETDEIGAHAAWSVVVKGTARRLDDAAAIEQARRSPLWTWMPREADVFLEIVPREITGRSFRR